jgi:putative transposase
MAGQRGVRGFDAGKKVLGRKRHILVDTLGLLLAVEVQPAHVQDRDGAKAVLAHAHWFGNLKVIWVDGGYAGQLETWFADQHIGRSARLHVVRKPPGPGFQLLPKRWVVERTFAWLSPYRRLARDYEVKTSHSKAFTYAAATRYMLRRLVKLSLQ